MSRPHLTHSDVNVAALPKAELHLHLDCSVGFDAVARTDPSVTREHYERAFVLHDKVVDLADCLDEFETCNQNAIDAAFLPAERKQQMRQKITAGFASQRTQLGDSQPGSSS